MSTGAAAATAAGVWCVIPVYNNGQTVRAVALGCRAELRNVVVVDDGCTDADVGALLRGTDIVVLRHEQNRGKGQALLTAIQYLKDRGARFMITVDADGQHRPEDIRTLLPVIEANPTSIVIGARRMNVPNVPFSSRFGMRFSDMWLRLETGLPVRDSQSGFRSYPVEYVSRLSLAGRRYDFEVEILAKAAWAGLGIVSVDIDVFYPERSKRISHFRPLLDNFLLTHRHALMVLRRLSPVPYRRLIPGEPSQFMRLIRHPVLFCKELLREHASPGELGTSAVVGVFLGAVPLIPHTVAIVYVTTQMRLNRIMAVAVQNVCMPPFVPVACIELGYFIRHGSWLREFSMETLWNQGFERIWEWIIGSLIIGPVLAAIVGFTVFGVASLIEKRAKVQG